MRSTVTSVRRVLTSTKPTNLLPCAGRWLPGTRFQALPLSTALATRGFFSLNRSFQVQWRCKGVTMAQRRSRRKKVSWSKS
uniref:Uncharacterized protein n=1 Tax=Hyaloperonospora arabidopsidis (strain Emoy2) TaxID=559515 RepID=M4BMX1_HYAAE